MVGRWVFPGKKWVMTVFGRGKMQITDTRDTVLGKKMYGLWSMRKRNLLFKNECKSEANAKVAFGRKVRE